MKGKQVKVNIKPKHIYVAIQQVDGNWTDVIDNDLTWEVNREESMWTLLPGELVHVSLIIVKENELIIIIYPLFLT